MLLRTTFRIPICESALTGGRPVIGIESSDLQYVTTTSVNHATGLRHFIL